jgi:aminopeptidase
MKNGVTCSPNIPTEEIFTMPDRTRVDGRVTSSKPLSLRGQIIDGIEVTFSNGEAIHARARSGEESLLQLLATDDGSKRLGEVALVPNSAITAKVGILFYNTLYDENAASHIALGGCYGENLEGYNEMSAEERLQAGANDSLIHVDWMIGSGEMNVDGVTDDGRSIPIMRAGEWVS